jgi:hypothetical protein
MQYLALFVMRKPVKIICALALVFWLGGCSSVKFAYSQAPDLLHLYLDRYFDFNSEQSQQVKSELVKLQAWHRQTQLPAYVETLQKLKGQMSADFSGAQACSIYADARSKLQSITNHVEPASAQLIMTFDENQFLQMEKKFTRDNAKFQKEYIAATAGAIRAKRLKDAIERAEKLYGGIDDQQVATLGRIIDRSRFDARFILSERQRRQQEMLNSLKTVALPGGNRSATVGKAEQIVRNLLAQTFESTDVRYRAYLGAMTQDVCDGFADFHNITTPAQRGRAVETLDKYARDFKTLAGQSPG